MPTDRQIRNGVIGAIAIGAGSALLQSRRRGTSRRTKRTRRRSNQSPHIKTARRLNRASGLIAISTLLDSALEHYRGSFENKAMYTPLIVSALTLGVSAHGASDPRSSAHKFRNLVYAAGALTGIAGTGFHLFNILGKRIKWLILPLHESETDRHLIGLSG